MAIEGSNNVTPTPVLRPTPGPTPNPTPATPASPRVAGDQLNLTAPGARPVAPGAESANQGGNVLDNSVERKVYDGVTQVANGADGARAIKPAVDAARGIAQGASNPLVARATDWFARAGQWIVNLGGKVTAAAPVLKAAVGGLARVAPILGAGIAALDIGKATMEKDPVKKQQYTGNAVLSTVAGAAGIVAIAFPPAAIVAVPVAIAASVLQFVDNTFLGGKVCKAIGGAVQAVGDFIGDTAKGIGNFFKGLFG